MHFLKEYLRRLEEEPVPLEIEYKGETLKGEAVPVAQTCKEDSCYEFDITLNSRHFGLIHCTPKGWTMKYVDDKKLVKLIGEELSSWVD